MTDHLGTVQRPYRGFVVPPLFWSVLTEREAGVLPDPCFAPEDAILGIGNVVGVG